MTTSGRRSEYGSLSHLARRFLGSLWPAGPGVAGEAWGRNFLKPAEVEAWKAMTGPDRRHGVTVARRVAVAMGNGDGAGVPRNALAAALLHDVGKSQSRLGVFGRSAATAIGLLAGRSRVAAWEGRPSGWRREAGRYAAHDEIGARLLQDAGSDPLVVAWAREHHLAEHQWSLDPVVASVLKAADDD